MVQAHGLDVAPGSVVLGPLPQLGEICIYHALAAAANRGLRLQPRRSEQPHTAEKRVLDSFEGAFIQGLTSRCGVGNRLMFPIAASSCMALGTPIPGNWSKNAAWASHGARLLWRASSASTCLTSGSRLSKIVKSWRTRSCSEAGRSKPSHHARLPDPKISVGGAPGYGGSAPPAVDCEPGFAGSPIGRGEPPALVVPALP